MRRLNCWVVAMYLWGSTRAKDWVGTRRSLWFRGLIPHFASFRIRAKHLTMVEYVPNRQKGEPRGDGDWLIVFPGVYRVTVYYRVVEVTSHDYEEAVRAAFSTYRKSKRW